MSKVIAVIKFLAFFLICLIAVPLQLLVMLVHKGRYSYFIPYFWHKMVCQIFRIRITVVGAPYTSGQVLYVSNHLSYLDIPAIGSVLRASFVAKKDVASWPVFGFLSKLQQTAFIDRARGAAAKEANALDSMLGRGKSLVIFPEGTSTDGQSVIPFKSSLFALVLSPESKNLAIQPFTIQVNTVNGFKPDTQELRDIYAWHRDMDTELPNHLWLFAKSRGAHIVLTFHDVIQASAFNDRKILANTCYEAVSKSIENRQSLAA